MCMCTKKESIQENYADVTEQDFDFEFVKKEFKDCNDVDTAIDLSCRYPSMIRYLSYGLKQSVEVAQATGLVSEPR